MLAIFQQVRAKVKLCYRPLRKARLLSLQTLPQAVARITHADCDQLGG